MNANGWRMADSDMHVMEPPDLWQRYIDPSCSTPRPSGSTRSGATCACWSRTTCCRSRTAPGSGHHGPPGSGGGRTRTMRTRHAEERGWDAQSQLDGDGRGSASTPRCCSRAEGCSCSGSTRWSRRAPTATSPSSRPRSRVRTTTGCTTSARRPHPPVRRRAARAARRRRRGRRGEALSSRTSGSRRCSCTRAA